MSKNLYKVINGNNGHRNVSADYMQVSNGVVSFYTIQPDDIHDLVAVFNKPKQAALASSKCKLDSETK